MLFVVSLLYWTQEELVDVGLSLLTGLECKSIVASPTMHIKYILLLYREYAAGSVEWS